MGARRPRLALRGLCPAGGGIPSGVPGCECEGADGALLLGCACGRPPAGTRERAPAPMCPCLLPAAPCAGAGLPVSLALRCFHAGRQSVGELVAGVGAVQEVAVDTADG